MAAVEDLVGIPLFGSLSDEQLEQVASWFHVRNADPGERLVGEDAHGYTFFVIVAGTAEVTAEGDNLATLGAGDYFGEIAILGAGRRSASVTSITPVRILVMFGTDFRNLEATHPEIAARITEQMRTRLAKSTARVAPTR